MPSNRAETSSVWSVARRELAGYFTSPVAFIFLGTFLLVSMFVFFWVERFFERNIVDVRPLFSWMPLLLIFLVAALTMRMWSEERRMGTIEFLLTVPVRLEHLVLGKFLACLGLIAVALLLTLGVPVTVSLMGTLDWGPVIGGYVAALLLAAAYTAIGLYVSARTENQIVSLIVTIVLGLLFYLVGSGTLTALVGVRFGEVLRLLSTSTRFESITRGVIDLRDLYYYLSLTGVFLTLNVYALERVRWTVGVEKVRQRMWGAVTTLLIMNLLVVNIWFHKFLPPRLDLTTGGRYTISEATEGVLERLQEPLLVRGYFSAKTHKLLAPLVPQLRDLIREYEAVSAGNVRTEFIDPRDNPELEEEANQKFGIKPVPLQVADKYQVSLVNSYFNILVQYGDKWEVLDFRDLIELRVGSDDQLEVELRNPEYDITRAIKKVLYGFKGEDVLLASITKPVVFKGFFSAEQRLPEMLRTFKSEVLSVLNEFKEVLGERLVIEVQDPEANAGALAQQLLEQYGFKPMATSILDPQTFYFYMVFEQDGDSVLVPLPEELNQTGIRSALIAGLKRFASGFLRTVGVSSPAPAAANPYMGAAPGQKQFRLLNNRLGENYAVKTVSLDQGGVPDDVDILLVLAPKDLDQRAVFAVDQFLMKGGTVLISTAPFEVDRSQQGLTAMEVTTGLQDWLTHHGVSMQPKIVMDPQNEAYPVPVRRQLGALAVEEIVMVNYPPFVDVRGSGLNKGNGITAGLQQVTINWAAPLEITVPEKAARQKEILLKSSPESWLAPFNSVQPDFQLYPQLGFEKKGESAEHVLAAIVSGRFNSFFADKQSPLLAQPADNVESENASEASKAEGQQVPVVSGVIEKSLDSARLIVFASNDFLNDQTLQISAATGSERYRNSLQLLENAVDWSLEDRDLLSIRSRSHYSQTLRPMSEPTLRFFEYLNYVLVLIGLVAVYVLYRLQRRAQELRYRALLKI